MKTRNVLTTVAVVGVVLLSIGAVSLFTRHSALTGAVGVRFAGFSKGQPNTFTSTLPSHYDSFIHEWLSSGTNVALFRVTNGQSRTLLLYPYAGFYDRTN